MGRIIWWVVIRINEKLFTLLMERETIRNFFSWVIEIGTRQGQKKKKEKEFYASLWLWFWMTWSILLVLLLLLLLHGSSISIYFCQINLRQLIRSLIETTYIYCCSMWCSSMVFNYTETFVTIIFYAV